MRARITIEASPDEVARLARVLSVLGTWEDVRVTVASNRGTAPVRGEAPVQTRRDSHGSIPPYIFDLHLVHHSKTGGYVISGYVPVYGHGTDGYILFRATDGGCGVLIDSAFARFNVSMWRGARIVEAWRPGEVEHVPVNLGAEYAPYNYVMRKLKEFGEGIYRLAVETADGIKTIYAVVGRTEGGKVMVSTPGVRLRGRDTVYLVEKAVLPGGAE